MPSLRDLAGPVDLAFIMVPTHAVPGVIDDAGGVSTLVTLGNESMIGTADVLDYLVDDAQTRVICLFLEEIGQPGRFADGAGRRNGAEP